MGPVDILVINASAQVNAVLADLAPEDLALQIDVNLRSTLEMLQAALPRMAARGWGRVVSLGSINQLRPKSIVTAYAATKAAQHNIIQSQARDYARHGVLLNTLAPGLVDTDRNADRRDADPDRLGRLRPGPELDGTRRKTGGNGRRRRLPCFGRLQLHDRGDRGLVWRLLIASKRVPSCPSVRSWLPVGATGPFTTFASFTAMSRPCSHSYCVIGAFPTNAVLASAMDQATRTRRFRRCCRPEAKIAESSRRSRA
jgi:hypothetical protein